jgi:hypothetical protein
MLRHPIYFLLCLGTIGYLAVADARGWSVIQSLSRSFVNATTGGRGHSFNHK